MQKFEIVSLNQIERGSSMNKRIMRNMMICYCVLAIAVTFIGAAPTVQGSSSVTKNIAKKLNKEKPGNTKEIVVLYNSSNSSVVAYFSKSGKVLKGRMYIGKKYLSDLKEQYKVTLDEKTANKEIKNLKAGGTKLAGGRYSVKAAEKGIKVSEAKELFVSNGYKEVTAKDVSNLAKYIVKYVK